MVAQHVLRRMLAFGNANKNCQAIMHSFREREHEMVLYMIVGMLEYTVSLPDHHRHFKKLCY